jgi:inhibitor of cysteine peptidase
MNRRISAMATVSCLLLAGAVVAGCSNSSTTSAATTAAKVPAAVVVTKADNGKQVDAAIGATLSVKLPGNPSTGYTWSSDGAVPEILKQDGEPSFEASSAGTPGSGGTMTMKYTVTTAGTGDLKLKYWRTFEPTTPPVSTFSVKVDAKAGSVQSPRAP